MQLSPLAAGTAPLELASRLAIATVLIWAGAAKAGQPEVVRNAADGLGLPRALASLAARGLALAELAIGVLLLVGATAHAASVAALSLLVAFTALIAWNLGRGRRPVCACFGEPGSEPIESLTLVRNAALALLALFVVQHGTHPGLLAAATGLVARAGVPATLAALLLAVLAQGLAIAFLIVRHRAPEARDPAVDSPASAVAGWPPGTRAPRFELTGLDGAAQDADGLFARGRPTLLFFTDPGCHPCRALLPEIARWQEAHGDLLTLALITRGSRAANRAELEPYGLHTVLLQATDEIARAYRVPGTPAAVAVSPDGRIASRVASGATPIRQLVEAWAERARVDAPARILSGLPVQGVLAGDPAPPFRLPARAGGEVDLFEYGGRPTLLLFWSPSCGYCARLLPEMVAWESSAGAGWCQLLVLTSGTHAATEAQGGFRSPVLFDEGGVVARAYGSTGTPAAVLVDAEGRVASEVAVGGEAVLTLARRGDALSDAAARLPLSAAGPLGAGA